MKYVILETNHLPAEMGLSSLSTKVQATYATHIWWQELTESAYLLL